MIRNSLYLLLPALSLAIVGCADNRGIKTAPVTGTVTVNGKPVRGVHLEFTPESGDRPSVANTDESGSFRAQFLKNQYGVTPGPCVVKVSYIVGDAMVNHLPKRFSEKAADVPELNIIVPPDGIVFDYDVSFDGELPPQN